MRHNILTFLAFSSPWKIFFHFFLLFEVFNVY
nr:MAG TPA: hypothetical protein [Caudoviricetes sp.]